MLTPLLLLLAALGRHAERSEASPLAETPHSARGDDDRLVLDYAGSQLRIRKALRFAQVVLIILLPWTLAGYIFFRESILKFWWDRGFLDWTINPLIRTDADRWLMPLVLLGRYMALLFAPVRLSPDYGGTVIGWTVSPGDPYLWLGAGAILAWVAWFSVALLRRRRVELFLLLCLALTYGIISNFPVLIGTNFGERLMYLPSAFFLILIALPLARLPRAALIALMSIVLILFSIRSFTYAKSWNDRLSFYQQNLARNPGSVRLQLLLISEHLDRKDYDEAERLASALTRQFPDYWESWIARANLAMERGQFDAAHDYLMTAAKTPRAPMNRVIRWMTLLEQKRSAATQPASRDK